MILVLDNIRSLYNVGAILRTAEACNIEKVIFCGITPYPKIQGDTRPFHIKEKADKAISKTALGAEKILRLEHEEDTASAVGRLKKSGRNIYALEQSKKSQDIFKFTPVEPFVLVVGHETGGVDNKIIDLSDEVLEIPMFGKKESLNVSVATGIALYQLLCYNK